MTGRPPAPGDPPMSRPLRIASSLALAASASACFAAPPAEGGDVVGSTGVDSAFGDEAPYTTSNSGDDGSSNDTSSAAGTDGSDTRDAGGTTTFGTDVDTGPTGDGTNGGLPPGFPSDAPFGDDVRELDLVGRWLMPWSPSGVPHVQLDIAADGAFMWVERDGDCTPLGAAEGTLWVEGTQLAMAVEVWDKTPPWDTVAATGGALQAPFRMRLGYTPMGGYLGVSGPRDLTAIAPWYGRGYARLDAGTGVVGSWVAESELWATPAGEDTPALIVRDRFDAHVPATSQAQLASRQMWWWPEGPVPAGDESESGPWIDETPGNIAGAASIVGVRHAYDALGLISFVADRSFVLGAPAPCP